jgi:hypothetical protein
LTNTLTYTYDAGHARIVEKSTVHGTTLYLGGLPRTATLAEIEDIRLDICHIGNLKYLRRNFASNKSAP